MSKIKLWRDALINIPRIETKSEWDALDFFSKWLISTRGAVLIMTAMSVAVGGFLAYTKGAFNATDFFLCMIGLICAHACNNYINDWVDTKKKIDDGNYYRTLYGTQALECGYWSFKQWFSYLSVTALIALTCGITLIFRCGIDTLYLMLAGAFFVLFYTWPLKYIGLGEPTVLLVWGPLMICGAYFVSSGGILPLWSPDIFLISIIYAIGPTNVLFGKHIDKRKEDKVKKVYTMPVILGQRYARYTAIGLWLAQYLLCALAYLLGFIDWPVLLVLLSLPSLFTTVRIFQKSRPEAPPKEYPDNVWPLYFSAYAFQYNKRFGGYFLLALILNYIWQII